MRRYCACAERDTYAALTPNNQRPWLLGRTAAKDAVRQWLWDRGEGPIFPGQVVVTNDPEGRPRVSVHGAAQDTDDLRISLAHTDGLGVALVAKGSDPGIDIELVEERGGRFDELLLGDSELALLPEFLDDYQRTRIWTAKEAAAKAAGTGLSGNPRRFPIESVEGECFTIAGRLIATTVFTSEAGEDYAVAWTTPPREDDG